MIDHLVIAGPELDSLIRWWVELTGVDPAPGGSHPGLGTANALVGLGPSSYIELIAPDPDQPEPGSPRPFGVDEITQPMLVTWAAAVDDLDAAVGRYRDAGIGIGDPRPMSRARPDGSTLSWRLAADVEPRFGGAVPFLIQWDDDTAHPAVGLPQVGELVTFGLACPDGDKLADTIRSVAPVDVGVGQPEIVATIARADGTELILGHT